ncbi:MAG TPA: TraM recognition domain-containing protein [Candidatus Saccharimonadales bacterium]|nr:TraM recognition domain-containing protein [Candidatus Saccharimonadales bacterium]
MAGVFIGIFVAVFLGLAAGIFIFSQYRKTLREAKNYERGLKMVPMVIHLPPSSEDIESGNRDERDITEEVLSQAQVMYNIIASTATRGFKSKIYGQRHLSLEIVAHKGLVHYYAVVPYVLVDVVRQAIAAAYPSARLEEVTEHNIFSQVGRMTGTIGGEFTLKKDFVYPIATYKESKQDASRALLNALSAAGREDGAAIQLMIRPAREGWAKSSIAAVERMRKDKGTKKSGFGGMMAPKDLMEALWKPPETGEAKPEDKQLTSLEQATVEAIEEKTRYPAYEVLVRVVVSSNTAARAQGLLKNIVAAFSLFDSPSFNGFKFTVTKNIEELVTAYIFRFFPQTVTRNILNSIELASIFHLPNQKNIPTAQVERQLSKQVDGPTTVMEEGFLLGYNEFRGVKKPIRLSTNDRRRHTYIIGQTGTGKSVLLENLAFQDMMDGRGFAFVDPHGDSVDTLLGKVPKERVEDVIYFNPGDMTNPIGLNMFEFDHPDQKDFLVQEAINMLYGLYDPGHTGIVGPRLEHIFRNCALLLMSDPNGGTFIDIPKLLIDEDFMKSKLKYVTDQTVLDFWTKEFPASQRSNEAGEVISWVVSKFGPFISNDAMRNIIGQTKSGFNLREIMDNKKILLVNLSKGKMGDLNSKLLGIIFVMKFQAAAMSRANILEDQRVDFSLYVDEFQNFATESFESILSEARKYRLNLILGNQFMTQLTEKIREAIIGNVGTVISGRIGITDAEILVKKFAPTFDAEDLTKMPNYQSVTSVMINNVPSAPFSMSFVPPMGHANPQLSDALKRLSAAKYGKPRAQVEKEIFARLGSADAEKKAKADLMRNSQQRRPGAPGGGGGSSFLDEWLAKRQQLGATKKPMAGSTPRVNSSPPMPASPPSVSPAAPPVPLAQNPFLASTPNRDSVEVSPQEVSSQPDLKTQTPALKEDRLRLRGDDPNHESEISIKLR